MLDAQTPLLIPQPETDIKCKVISSSPFTGPSHRVCIGQFPHSRTSSGSLPPDCPPGFIHISLLVVPSTASFHGPQPLCSTQREWSGLHRLVAFVQNSNRTLTRLKHHFLSNRLQPWAGLGSLAAQWKSYHICVFIYCLSITIMLTPNKKTLVCSVTRSYNLPYGLVHTSIPKCRMNKVHSTTQGTTKTCELVVTMFTDKNIGS